MEFHDIIERITTMAPQASWDLVGKGTYSFTNYSKNWINGIQLLENMYQYGLNYIMTPAA